MGGRLPMAISGRRNPSRHGSVFGMMRAAYNLFNGQLDLESMEWTALLNVTECPDVGRYW